MVGESSGLGPLLQQGVEDDVELLFVVCVGHHAGQRGVVVRGGGHGDGQGGVELGSQNLLRVADGNVLSQQLHDVSGHVQRDELIGVRWGPGGGGEGGGRGRGSREGIKKVD